MDEYFYTTNYILLIKTMKTFVKILEEMFPKTETRISRTFCRADCWIELILIEHSCMAANQKRSYVTYILFQQLVSCWLLRFYTLLFYAWTYFIDRLFKMLITFVTLLKFAILKCFILLDELVFLNRAGLFPSLLLLSPRNDFIKQAKTRKIT
jgi:hypothetical protein